MSKAVTLLLGLVFISFGCGKTASDGNGDAASAGASSQGRPDRAVVYMMHRTIRCAACKQVETMTDELLRTEFANELKDGRVEWKQVDFQEQEKLAKRYGVTGSTLVVVRFQDAKEIAHQRLDDVWGVYSDPGQFAGYVGGAIRAALPKEKA